VDVGWDLDLGLSQGLLSALVADSTPENLCGTAFGLFNLVSGGALLIASVLAGWLWQSFGETSTFVASAAFSGIAVLIMFVGEGRNETSSLKSRRRVQGHSPQVGNLRHLPSRILLRREGSHFTFTTSLIEIKDARRPKHNLSPVSRHRRSIYHGGKLLQSYPSKRTQLRQRSQPRPRTGNLSRSCAIRSTGFFTISRPAFCRPHFIARYPTLNRSGAVISASMSRRRSTSSRATRLSKSPPNYRASMPRTLTFNFPMAC